MRAGRVVLIVVAACVLSLFVVVVISLVSDSEQSSQEQSALDPFYTPPDPLIGKPGDIIRSEPLDGFAITGANGYRILYISQNPAGQLQASGGMVWIPTAPAQGKRDVVAYAHGTSGFGDACAPSRDPNTPTSQPFIQTLIDRGYVYTATDYVGLGTPGEPYYMIGRSEATDVVNSVRAAQRFAGANAGSRYAVMGHSQGGHSALWTGALSKQIAPELELVGVAASAPATQLVPLLEQQWNTMIGWAIGPEVAVSWPVVYPALSPVTDIMTSQGADNYQSMAYECLEVAGLQGYAEEAFGNQMFATSPAGDPDWRATMQAETPQPLPATMPVMITQAMQDGIVLANTNALTQQVWCQAGSNLEFNWLGQLATGPLASAQTHEDTLYAAWPMEIDWFQDRFAGRPAQPNCAFTPPVTPASQ